MSKDEEPEWGPWRITLWGSTQVDPRLNPRDRRRTGDHRGIPEPYLEEAKMTPEQILRFNRAFAARFGHEPQMTAFIDGKKLDDLTVEELRAAVLRLVEERDAAWEREYYRTRSLT